MSALLCRRIRRNFDDVRENSIAARSIIRSKWLSSSGINSIQGYIWCVIKTLSALDSCFDPSKKRQQKTLPGRLDVATWMPEQIEAFGFVEHEDYEVFIKTDKNPQGGRPSREYLLSITMAKELAMAQRVTV